MLESEGKFIKRPTQTGEKLYDKFFIYVPTEVARDSLFPSKTNDKVKVRIDTEKNRLVIEKSE